MSSLTIVFHHFWWHLAYQVDHYHRQLICIFKVFNPQYFIITYNTGTFTYYIRIHISNFEPPPSKISKHMHFMTPSHQCLHKHSVTIHCTHIEITILWPFKIKACYIQVWLYPIVSHIIRQIGKYCFLRTFISKTFLANLSSIKAVDLAGKTCYFSLFHQSFSVLLYSPFCSLSFS